MAATVHVPTARKLSAPPEVIVQVAAVDELKETVRPELAVAASVGVVVAPYGPGLEKAIVCANLGVTLFDATDAGPVPAALVALTVKV
jgi:hypothetical protein